MQGSKSVSPPPFALQVGTYQIAMVAKALGKPVYVAVESYKFVRSYPLAQSDVQQPPDMEDPKLTTAAGDGLEVCGPVLKRCDTPEIWACVGEMLQRCVGDGLERCGHILEICPGGVGAGAGLRGSMLWCLGLCWGDVQDVCVPVLGRCWACAVGTPQTCVGPYWGDAPDVYVR